MPGLFALVFVSGRIPEFTVLYPENYGEPRYVAFGEIDDALYCLVFTFRGSKARAISPRKANQKEIRRYGRQAKI
jgi:uncharacterized DUF497 family protein